MANYKNMKFSNTLKDFKKWCQEFAPLERGSDIVFYKKGYYYCSIEKVKGFLGGDGFAGVTIRKYDRIEQDFDLPYGDDKKHAEEIFKDEIRKYKEKIQIG